MSFLLGKNCFFQLWHIFSLRELKSVRNKSSTTRMGDASWPPSSGAAKRACACFTLQPDQPGSYIIAKF